MSLKAAEVPKVGKMRKIKTPYSYKRLTRKILRKKWTIFADLTELVSHACHAMT